MAAGQPLRYSALALLVTALAGATAGACQQPPPATRDSLEVVGRVVDRVSGEELPAVRVSLRWRGDGRADTVVWQGLTDESGSFLSARVPALSYEVRAEALAFRPVAEPLDLRGRRRVEIRVEMVPEAVELEAVVVTSRDRSRLEASGFYERRRLGFGHSFTREDIEARNPLRVSDLLRTVPGMQVVPGRGGVGATLRYRGSCQPNLVVDGVPLSRPVSIDEILSPGDLEALEVHSSSYFPGRIGSSTCGTVVAWTREGQRGEGRPMTWRRALVAAGLVLLGILLVR
jgi:hypothetical protein